MSHPLCTIDSYITFREIFFSCQDSNTDSFITDNTNPCFMLYRWTQLERVTLSCCSIASKHVTFYLQLINFYSGLRIREVHLVMNTLSTIEWNTSHANSYESVSLLCV